MRRIGIALCIGLLPPSAAAQEPAPPRETVRFATGSLEGTIAGKRDTVLYNGDRVAEQFSCKVRMTFNADSTMTYRTERYFYEYTYTHPTTNGGTLVRHVRVEAGPDDGQLDSALRIGVTQYGDVWRAGWTKRVEIAAHHLEESWLTHRNGQRYGHKVPIDRNDPFYCEPKIYWRDYNNRGPGLSLKGTASWPDVKYPWATATASWDFTPLRQ